MASRLGVDVGGTFTDLIYYDHETGEVWVGKGSTVPASPEIGVLRIVDERLSPDDVADSSLFFHGTTVGINSIVERKGAVVGLLTTAGFRDVLELRRADRGDFYNLWWKAASPLVPRRLRLAVTERVRHDGVIHIPLDENDIRDAAATFLDESVESVAVVFINSYKHPHHEVRAAEVLREAGFTGHISLSHHVTGEYREYERTTTAIIDAYVRPRLSTYLGNLRDGLEAKRFQGECLVTRSGGGSISFSEAVERPFETIMSGPVAGAAGAAELCRLFDIDLAVTADVGGTTFDTCVIMEGSPQLKYEGQVADMPLQTDWIDVRSIGAGGGSVAFQEDGMLRVGPRSAGADPGPVCYGLGGTEPTVTDAAATLGMLGHGELAGGVTLDLPAAREAVEQFGRSLDLDVDRTAQGIIEITAVAMAGQMRAILEESGEDPAQAAVLAYGGAGPLFGTLIARELGAGTVIVPNFAGNFSAWGLLLQDLSRSIARTVLVSLDDTALESVTDFASELRKELQARTAGTMSKLDSTETVVTAVDLRYTGQEYFLTLEIPVRDGRVAISAEQLAERFAADYVKRYGHALSSPVEIVSVRVSATTPLPRTNLLAAPTSGDGPKPKRRVDAFSFANGQRGVFDVVDRAALTPGSAARGPMIVLEETATTYVDAEDSVSVDDTGTMTITTR